MVCWDVVQLEFPMFFAETDDATASVHQYKCQDVKGYLPKAYYAEYERKIRAAWAMSEYEDAKNALRAVVRELERSNTKAAASLEEGFEETLTLHRIGVPTVLRVHLQTTNTLESPFAHACRVMRNVKRWRANTDQSARWIAAGLLHAEKRMRRTKGYKSMSVLIAVLEAEAARRAGIKQTNAA
jgi:putative transposase